MTSPANNLNNNGVVDVIRSTEPNKNSNDDGLETKNELSTTGDLTTNNCELTFNDLSGAKTSMQRTTSWYDGFFGCLKPVWTFMGKNKPSNLQNANEGKIIYINCMKNVTKLQI